MTKIRIGIIGASYCGLCLARTLTTKYNNIFEVTLLELRDRDVICATSGSLQLNAFLTFKTLHLEDLYHASLQECGRKSKTILLQGLIQSVQDKIFFNTKVEDIICEKTNEMRIECIDHTTTTSSEFEFDIIIGTDGLTSQSRAIMSRKLNSTKNHPLIPYLMCGDSTIVFGRELFCGYHRTRYGANKAMADAVSLADMLGTAGMDNGTNIADRVQFILKQTEIYPYTLEYWYQTRRRNTMSMLVIFCIVCVLFFRIEKGIEVVDL